MKRYVSLVCNEFVTRDYTVLYLVSKLAQAGTQSNLLKCIKMHAKIFRMDKLSDLGHIAGPAICDLISVLRTVQIFY